MSKPIRFADLVTGKHRQLTEAAVELAPAASIVRCLLTSRCRLVVLWLNLLAEDHNAAECEYDGDDEYDR